MTLRTSAQKRPKKAKPASASAAKHFAVIGAGIAGVACARTLVQAGHRVTVFERGALPGGRMASEATPFGSFDSGAQYFTVRDPRFKRVLQTTPELCRPWSANAVRVLDARGRVAEASLPRPEPHFVAQPGMNALVAYWARPLGESLQTGTQVTHIERDALDPARWQLRTLAEKDESIHVYSGFDAVLLATPPNPARRLLGKLSPALTQHLAPVKVAPCWSLMIAFPNANQPTLSHLGPQWNAARSTHHRVAWLARESSKPGRQVIERWTLQASADWSQEHLQDDAPRVQAKLLRAFAEITGIRAEPSYAHTRCWPEAQTLVPAGQPHLWDAKTGLGAAGDWCTGHRVEEAFLSGLSLALAVH